MNVGIPNMDRIAGTAHTRAQDGAMLGSQVTFYGVQVEVQKGVMLGPWKLDVGDPKRANRGSILGVQKEVRFRSNLSRWNSPVSREFQRLEFTRFKSLELPVPAT